jgi:hypothetical protein
VTNADAVTEKEAMPVRRQWVTWVIVGIIVLSIVPPRGEFGRYLPALMAHSFIVAFSFGVGLFVYQRVWLVGRDLARVSLCFVAIYLLYYFILYPNVWG